MDELWELRLFLPRHVNQTCWVSHEGQPEARSCCSQKVGFVIDMWQSVVTRNYYCHRKCCWSGGTNVFDPRGVNKPWICLCCTDPRVYYMGNVLNNKRDSVNGFDSEQRSQQAMENNMFWAEEYCGVQTVCLCLIWALLRAVPWWTWLAGRWIDLIHVLIEKKKV